VDDAPRVIHTSPVAVVCAAAEKRLAKGGVAQQATAVGVRDTVSGTTNPRRRQAAQSKVAQEVHGK